MRPLIVLVALIGLSQSVAAADFRPPYLRGSDVYAPGTPTYFRWSGAYFGAQLGVGSAHFDFARSTKNLVAFILRESSLENDGHVSDWRVLGTANRSGLSYGGFFGYNGQWDDMILGVEVNYNRTSLRGSAADSLSRGVTPGDGFSYFTTVDAEASTHVTDFGTLRFRVGQAMGRFLPYVMAGLAAGRARVTRTVTVTADITDTAGELPPGTFGPVTKSETRPLLVYGYAAGLGVDVAVTPTVFLRGEYEFIQFTSIKTGINTARAALGFKF